MQNIRAITTVFFISVLLFALFVWGFVSWVKYDAHRGGAAQIRHETGGSDQEFGRQ